MDLATYKKFKGDRLMPWGKATVVKDAKGYVFLAGNAATGEDYDPLNQRGGATGDPAMQWRAILANIKSDLEEVGSSLDHLVKLTFYVKGPPNTSHPMRKGRRCAFQSAFALYRAMPIERPRT